MSDIDVEPVENVDEETAEDSVPIEEQSGTTVGDDGSTADGLDVEVEELPTVDSDTPEYVLYGGKGGVGKTTMAAATGLASAQAGSRTLVVSTDPAHSLSDTYETAIEPEPTRITDELPLWAVEIDPDAAIEEGAALFGGEGAPQDDPFAGSSGPQAEDDPFGDAAGDSVGGDATGDPFSGDAEAGPFGGAEGPMGGLGDLVGGENPMESLFGGTMPGADEAVAMQKLVEYLDDDRFDRVIVDTAPTGHTLRLLKLPELMDSMVGRMLTIRERIGGMLDGFKGMFGGETPDQDAGIDELRELSDGIEQLRTALQDPTRTDFRIVMVPEEMSVLESRRLRERLREFSVPVSTVVVNRVMEPLADVTDEADADAVLSPDLDGCAFCQQRWSVQQKALANAQELFRGHDVKRVPLFAEEVKGERMLRVVAACLE